MKTLVKPAVLLFITLSVITGLVYPLLTTGVARIVFPRQTAGNLVLQEGKVVGSSLIGQDFSDPKYFWGRLSATAPQPYNASASSGSNLGPLNPALQVSVKARVVALQNADPGNTLPVPVDLVTASGSGLDPHISPAAAEYQVSRVARMRGLSPERVRELVTANTESRQLGVLGEPRVNVLALNRALDTLH